MTTPLISIIVPCYSQAQYLDECLQSVIDQTFGNWECIIVNDGSPDNTEEIAQKWVANDARFIYLKKENGGVSSARNFGMKEARGEWILPLDGDDKIECQYLELASLEFPNHYDIIYCNGEYFGAHTGKIVLDDFNPEHILLENQLFCTAFFRKEDALKMGGFDESMTKGYEDWEFWIQLIASKNGKISVKKINKTEFYYRIKEVSRNTEAMLVNDAEIKKHIITKHQNLFLDAVPSFYTTFKENKKLKTKISHLESILNSKRYQTINRFLSVFKF